VSLVIVGNGMVSARLCERLAQLGVPARHPVVVIAEEETPAYDRIRLSELFGSERSLENLQIRPREWYASVGIELHTKERVESIFRDEQKVATSSGRRIPYQRLVLATGAAPIRPAVPGMVGSAVKVYRSAGDRESIAREARAGARVAILGGGLLGIELADALVRRGCEVILVEQAPRLLPRQLESSAAALLEANVRARGIDVRCARTLMRAVAGSDGVRLGLAEGASIEADLLVVCAGVRPRDELARSADLACHRRGGVLVDDTLTTSDPMISAIGECAVHRDVAYGTVAPGYAMAEVLAERLAGRRARFEGTPFSARLKLEGLDVAVIGESQAADPGTRAVTLRKDAMYRRLVLRDGRLVGAIAVGPWSALPRLQEAIARRARLRASGERRFATSGDPFRAGAARSIAAWPDHAIVCTCTGTTCAALRGARAAGCASAQQLREATGASSVCGSCRPLLEELCGESATPLALRRGALAAGAVAATVLVVALLALPPIAMLETVQLRIAWDQLWRAGVYRQLSGFVLVAALVASIGLSLRKRVPRVRVGSYEGWRSVHASLGAGTVALAALHTGLRLGEHGDRALMLSFLALACAGVIAAAAAVLESRLGPAWGGYARRVSTWMHIFALYPLPVLLGFHVFKVYYF
jgi:nitrite reductase (NADH) large subunit